MSSQASETDYHRPETIDEVCEHLASLDGQVKVVSGGQSLSLLLRQNMLDPDALVDISGVSELSGTTEDDDTIRIGATTTYTDFQSSPFADRYGALSAAVDVIADKQVRNAGTIGGAISHADPYLDIVPALLCYDATVKTQSVDGTRTTPLEEFCWGYLETELKPNEVVTAVEFESEERLSGTYSKASNIHGGWATVGVAATMARDLDTEEVESTRVALSGVGDTAIRAEKVESRLRGQIPTDDVIAKATEAAVEEIDPLGDVTGSAQYKERLAENLTKRVLSDVRTQGSDTA